MTCWIISGSSSSPIAMAGIQTVPKYWTWSSINAINGEITTSTLEPRGLELRISATMGIHWKMSDFPKPVGKFTKRFPLSMNVLIESSCSGKNRSIWNWFFTDKTCFESRYFGNSRKSRWGWRIRANSSTFGKYGICTKFAYKFEPYLCKSIYSIC